MKNHHKIGIAITCTFLCLCGAVIGLKLQDAHISEKPGTPVAEKNELEKKKSTSSTAAPSSEHNPSPASIQPSSPNNTNLNEELARITKDALLQLDSFGGVSSLNPKPISVPNPILNSPSNPDSSEIKRGDSGPSGNLQPVPRTINGFEEGKGKQNNINPLGNAPTNVNDRLQFTRKTEPTMGKKDEQGKTSGDIIPVSDKTPVPTANGKTATNNGMNSPPSATPLPFGPGSISPTHQPASPGASPILGQQSTQNPSNPIQTPATSSGVQNPKFQTVEPVISPVRSSSTPPSLGPSAVMPGPNGTNLSSTQPVIVAPVPSAPLNNATSNANGNPSQGTSPTTPASPTSTPSSVQPMLGGSLNPGNGQTTKSTENSLIVPSASPLKPKESTRQPSNPLSGPASVSPVVPLPTSSAPPAPTTPGNVPLTPAPASPFSPASMSPVPASPSPTAATPIPQPPAPPKNPPQENSFYIPDQQPSTKTGGASPSSDKNGPVGLMPSPLPLPTAPASPGFVSNAEKSLSSNNPSSRLQTASAPTVSSYSEQVYECQPGDTFEKISEKFYMGAKYAEALKRHNQLHPRSNLSDSGTMTPGTRIYIPQAYVLDQQYADAISRPATASTAGPVPVPLNPMPQR